MASLGKRVVAGALKSIGALALLGALFELMSFGVAGALVPALVGAALWWVGARIGGGVRQVQRQTPLGLSLRPGQRLRIQYVDAAGESSERVIQVRGVEPGGRLVQAWCELRNAERSFRVDRMRQVVDAETGEILTMGRK
ncbi:MAG: WYL domain-containing protein [Leptothrix sp. (in: b-proteobacteria)]